MYSSNNKNILMDINNVTRSFEDSLRVIWIASLFLSFLGSMARIPIFLKLYFLLSIFFTVFICILRSLVIIISLQRLLQSIVIAHIHVKAAELYSINIDKLFKSVVLEFLITFSYIFIVTYTSKQHCTPSSGTHIHLTIGLMCRKKVNLCLMI